MNGMKTSLKNKKMLLSLGVVAAVILLCVLTALLPFRWIYPDVSGDGAYRVSDTSKQFLSNIREDVELIYYSEGGKHSADKDLYGFVQDLAAESPFIRVRLEDPVLTGADVADQSITVRSAKREKNLAASELFYYHNAYFGAMSIEEYAQVLTQMKNTTDTELYNSYLSVYGPSQMTAYNSADAALTSAVRYVLADRAPVLYAYGNGGHGINSLLRASLEHAGYSVATLSSMDSVPTECEGLYLALVKDLTAVEAASLTAYLSNGGKVFLTTSYSATKTPNLSAVLSVYGLSSPDELNYLCVLNSSSNSSNPVSTQFYAVRGDHHITDTIGDSFVADTAHLIQNQPVEGVTQTVLLRTSSDAYYVNAESKEIPVAGSYPLCVLAEKDDSAVLWLSMPLDSTVNTMSSGADFAFVKKSFDFFTGYPSTSLNIADAKLPSSYLNVQPSAVVFWIVVFAVAIPAVLLIAGGVRCYIRKKRG